MTLGLALLATGTGCTGTATPSKIGGGPPGTNTAAPAQLVPPGATAPASTKPNIVEIVTDDMRTDDLRFMPHVRRLVQDQGLEFLNSFSPNPICAPARSSLLSGQYSHNTKVMAVTPPRNYAAFDDRATVATALNGAGYNTVFLGKYLNGYGVDDSFVTKKNSFRYVPPGWTDWWGSTQRPADSGIASGGTYNYFNVLINHNGTIDDSHKGTYQATVQGRIARRMVNRYHRSAKPFFLYFAPVAPHFGAPREKDDPRGVVWPDSGRKEEFKTPARPARVRGRFDRQITRASGLPLDGGASQRDVSRLPAPIRLPPISTQEKAAMLTLTRQRAEALSVLDGQIGRLVATLKQTGEYDNTVLMFTSDNGYYLGEHRLRQGKLWTHEPSLRVPFLVTGPGIPTGRRFDPVTSPDIAATILDLGGARPPHPADGVSVRPSFAADRGWTVPVAIENLANDKEMRTPSADPPQDFGALTGSGLRTARWKYVRYVNGDAELYDLTADPNELRNVYGRPRYAKVQAALADVWKRTRHCAGESCRAPLPRSLRVVPAPLAESTRTQERGVQARYGVPEL